VEDIQEFMQSTYGCMLLVKVDREVLGLGQHVYHTIVFKANSGEIMSKLCLTFNVKKHVKKTYNCVHLPCKKLHHHRSLLVFS
jgi:hypothetical protein